MNSKISGSITYADYLRATFHSERYLLAIEILAVVTLVYLLLPENTTLLISILLYLLAIIIITLIHSILIHIRVKLEYTNIDKRVHKKIVKMSEKGVEYGTKENLMFFQWKDIRKRVFLKQHILLYISTKQSLILPKHFFSSAKEEKEWITFIKKHLSI